MKPFTLKALALTLFLCVCTRTGVAQSTDVLNPYTVSSPNGRVELRIEPSLMRGVGPCELTMTRDGTELWKRELDTTVWHAATTDEGRSMLVAYRYGGTGRPHFNDERSENVITLLVLDSDGTTLSRENLKRGGGMMHGPAVPTVTDVIALPTMDLGIVETSGVRNLTDNWHRFRLSTGEKLAAVFPDHEDRARSGNRHSILTEPIPGTPFVLKVWDRSYWGEDQPTEQGFRLAVLNHAGTAVWSRIFHDEQDMEHEDASWRSFRELRVQQIEVENRAFSFRSLVLDQTLRFECEPSDNGKWTVREAGAEPGCGLLDHPAITGVKPDSPLDALEQFSLNIVDTIELVKHKGPPPVIDWVTNFRFDSDGRIGFVGKGKGGFELRIVSTEGELLQAVPLGFVESERTPTLIPRTGSTWLIGSPEYEPGRVWELDPQSGESRLLYEMTEGQNINALVALPDGGFIAGITDRSNGGWNNALIRVGSQGDTIWSNDEHQADNLVLMPNDTIATLNDGNDVIKLLNLDGTHLEDIVLEDKFGYTTYPCGLNADGSGGLWVFFQDRNHEFYHLGADAGVLPMLSPKLKNGQRFGSSTGVRAAPDGSTWASDGKRIMRLGPDGTADLTLGDDPDTAPPRAFGPIVVAPDGNFFALNRSTGVVHVIDQQGNEIDQRRGPPKYKYNRARSLAVGHDSTIVFNFGMGGNTLRLDADGNFLGVFDSYMDETTESYFPNPTAPGGWAIGYRTVAVINPDGEIDTHITKRPSGEWLESPGGVAYAPDGSVAISAGLAMQRSDPNSNGSSAICIYNTTGDPIATIPAINLRYTDSSKMVFDPPWVVISEGPRLLVYDTRPNEIGLYPAPRAVPLPQIEGEQDYWSIFRTGTPGQLFAGRAGSTQLLRLKLPDP